MIVNQVWWNVATRQRLQILCRQADSARDSSVDVIALLKIDVLKEIAAYTSCGNRITIHVGPGQMRNRALNRHQSLAQVFVNAGFHLNCHILIDSLGSNLKSATLNYTQTSGMTLRTVFTWS